MMAAVNLLALKVLRASYPISADMQRMVIENIYTDDQERRFRQRHKQAEKIEEL